jgi:hypothetical protein
MNLKLALPTSLKPVLKSLSKARTAMVGLILIGIFGYTAYVVNTASNVKSDATSGAKTTKIVFDKATLKALSTRDQVSDQTVLGTLGKPDPFTR